MTERDRHLDELDKELAAVGVDVTRLQRMDDLDLQLYALGIDIDPGASGAGDDPARNSTRPLRNGRGVDDGLWGMELPPSDGPTLVRTPSDAVLRPTRRQDQLGRRTTSWAG